MNKKEEIQHWQRELERCYSDPGYFFQEYYVTKKIHDLEEAPKKRCSDQTKK
jgi:hypothetical protein